MNEVQTQTEQENKDVVADYLTGYQELQLIDLEAAIRKARNAIFIVAALVVVFDIIAVLGQGGTFADLWLTAIVAGIFVGLGFLANKQPYIAILCALILFVLIWVAGVLLVDITYLFKGIIWKVYVIYSLVKALEPSRQAEAIRKEMKLQGQQ